VAVLSGLGITKLLDGFNESSMELISDIVSESLGTFCKSSVTFELFVVEIEKTCLLKSIEQEAKMLQTSRGQVNK
jgi:hypothetical protein